MLLFHQNLSRYAIFSPEGTCQVPLLLSQNHLPSFDEQIHPEVSWIRPLHWQGPNICEVEEGAQLFRPVCSVKESFEGPFINDVTQRGGGS